MDNTEKIQVYKAIIKELMDRDEHRYRIKEFVDRVKRDRKDLKFFRYIVEKATGKSWREVPFQVHKIKECEVCGRPFYDTSRNGRQTVCHWVKYRRYNYEARQYHTPMHKDGTSKSNCEMKKEADRKRKKFNVDKYGVADAEYSRQSYHSLNLADEFNII